MPADPRAARFGPGSPHAALSNRCADPCWSRASAGNGSEEDRGRAGPRRPAAQRHGRVPRVGLLRSRTGRTADFRRELHRHRGCAGRGAARAARARGSAGGESAAALRSVGLAHAAAGAAHTAWRRRRRHAPVRARRLPASVPPRLPQPCTPGPRRRGRLHRRPRLAAVVAAARRGRRWLGRRQLPDHGPHHRDLGRDIPRALAGGPHTVARLLRHRQPLSSPSPHLRRPRLGTPDRGGVRRGIRSGPVAQLDRQRVLLPHARLHPSPLPGLRPRGRRQDLLTQVAGAGARGLAVVGDDDQVVHVDRALDPGRQLARALLLER